MTDVNAALIALVAVFLGWTLANVQAWVFTLDEK